MGNETRPLLEWIDAYRKRRSWNYTEFGRAAGIDPSVLSRWFGGARPRPEMLTRMAEHLGEDRNELMNLAGYVTGPREDSPEVITLVSLLRQVEMTPDRFRILETLLDDLRRRDPQD